MARSNHPQWYTVYLEPNFYFIVALLIKAMEVWKRGDTNLCKTNMINKSVVSESL